MNKDRKPKCLIVEDAEHNQAALVQLMTMYSDEIDSYALTDKGLEAFEMHENTGFDIVFLDISLNDGSNSGFDNFLYKLPESKRALPIVAIVSGVEWSKEQYLKANYLYPNLDFLWKPFFDENGKRKILSLLRDAQKQISLVRNRYFVKLGKNGFIDFDNVFSITYLGDKKNSFFQKNSTQRMIHLELLSQEPQKVLVQSFDNFIENNSHIPYLVQVSRDQAFNFNYFRNYIKTGAERKLVFMAEDMEVSDTFIIPRLDKWAFLENVQKILKDKGVDFP